MELARLLVDLQALRANYRRIKAVAPRAAAVVKADAYGLGAAKVAAALRQEGCDHFFVATTAEGVALRRSERDANVYVFSGPMDAADADALAAHRLTPVLNDAAQTALWRAHRDAPAAVHVDTGMNRLGFAAADLDPALFAGIDVRLVLSHLANADDPADAMNARQRARFDAVRRLFPDALASLGNSAGSLCGAAGDLARPGIALYGGNPFSRAPNPMLAVATLQARVLALRSVAAGQPVGYGGAFVTAAPTRIAVLGVGYADGVPRRLRDAQVAHRGRRLPVVGRVSMDVVQIDATAAETIAVGDWVEIFGATVGVDEVAARAGTISYEVLAGIGPRVPRRHSPPDANSAAP